MVSATSTRELVFWYGWSALQPEIRETLSPWVKGVSELRVDYGPGYRVYYKQQGQEVVVLLAGGDKRTQANDIKT